MTPWGEGFVPAPRCGPPALPFGSFGRMFRRPNLRANADASANR